MLECGPNPLASICSTEPGGSIDESVAETCDGLDNDCDGGTDDDFSVGQPCSGTGQCAVDPNGNPGVTECASPSSSRCSIEPGGSNDQSDTEICDPDIDNDCDGMTDEAGVCAASFVITSHTNGAAVDCSDPKLVQPRFEWFHGPYDRFKAELSWDPNFVKGKTIRPFDTLTDPIWEPNGQKWKKACRKAIMENPTSPILYLRIFGKDLDTPKGDPNREVESPVVTVVPTP